MYFDRRNCRRIRDLVEICGFLEVAMEQLEKLERETLLEIEKEKAQKAINSVNMKQEPQSSGTNSSRVISDLNDTPTTSTNNKLGPGVVLNSGIALTKISPSSTNDSTLMTPLNNGMQRMENGPNMSAGHHYNNTVLNSTETSRDALFNPAVINEVLHGINGNEIVASGICELKHEVKIVPTPIEKLLDPKSKTSSSTDHMTGFTPQQPDHLSYRCTNDNESFDSCSTINNHSSHPSTFDSPINHQNITSLPQPSSSTSKNEKDYKVFIKFIANFSENEVRHILKCNGFINIKKISVSNSKAIITVSEESELHALLRMRKRKTLNQLSAHYLRLTNKTKPT